MKVKEILLILGVVGGVSLALVAGAGLLLTRGGDDPKPVAVDYMVAGEDMRLVLNSMFAGEKISARVTGLASCQKGFCFARVFAGGERACAAISFARNVPAAVVIIKSVQPAPGKCGPEVVG